MSLLRRAMSLWMLEPPLKGVALNLARPQFVMLKGALSF